MIEPFSAGASRRHRGRPLLLGVAGVLVLVVGSALVLALLWWPRVTLARDSRALARVSLPGFAGELSGVVIRDRAGNVVPAQIRKRRIWPARSLRPGEPLTIRVTVRRPGWAGWLVGRTEQRVYRVRTPAARLRSRWLQVAAGAKVTVSFSAPVQAVRVRVGSDEKALRLGRGRKSVGLGIVASGSRRSGSALVSAITRLWERQPKLVRVTWFPVSPRTQALVEPAAGTPLRPGDPITITLSKPLAKVLGGKRPALTPEVPGRWRMLDTHTLSFNPAGLGYPIGADVSLRLGAHVDVTAASVKPATRSTLRWSVPDGSLLRLQQLLAQAGYLPLNWTPTTIADTSATAAESQLDAVTAPPPGVFSWRYPNTPHELKSLWRPGRPNEITRAAIMMFQDTHRLEVDSFAGPKFWQALLTDTLAGKHRNDGYSYVYVHRKLPQSLNLWHNGRLILSSPGNTGVPAAPTQLGSFPVFEHIPVGTMSGTNPDGSHYHDPGIRYISYFNHGDAIHAFNRASFGTPQSLGCVELPLPAAAKVWPYTPIGTLVTVEN